MTGTLGTRFPDETTGRLEALLRFGTAVARAEEETGALEAIVDQASMVAGATLAVVGLIEGNLVRVAASRGVAPGRLDDGSTFPIEPGRPMTDAIALGEAIFCSNA